MNLFTALLTALMLFMPAVFAANQQDMEPKNFCYDGCSARQQEIWAAFESAKYAPQAGPAVFSGECFHLSSSYDKNHAHHGFFYISQVGEKEHASGRFMFFAEENPYAKWDVETAQKESTGHEDPSRGLRPLVKSAFLDFSTEEVVWRYWIRQSEDQKKLYVVGQWGAFHLMFCEMPKH